MIGFTQVTEYLSTEPQYIDDLKCPRCGRESIYFEYSKVIPSTKDGYMVVTSNRLSCGNKDCEWERIL